MLIKQVTVFGGFELLYLALKSVGSFLPTLFSVINSLPNEVRELYKMAVIIFVSFIAPKLFRLITHFFNLINEKL